MSPSSLFGVVYPKQKSGIESATLFTTAKLPCLPWPVRGMLLAMLQWLQDQAKLAQRWGFVRMPSKKKMSGLPSIKYKKIRFLTEKASGFDDLVTKVTIKSRSCPFNGLTSAVYVIPQACHDSEGWLALEVSYGDPALGRFK